MEVEINDKKYKVIKDYKNVFNKEEVEEYLTSYFDNFDYVLGDYAYNKLRLKGFNKKTNKNFKPINDYEKLDDYLENYCAYGCKYFVLERLQ